MNVLFDRTFDVKTPCCEKSINFVYIKGNPHAFLNDTRSTYEGLRIPCTL